MLINVNYYYYYYYMTKNFRMRLGLKQHKFNHSNVLKVSYQVFT